MKFFTPKEASKTLPYVKCLVVDALKTGKVIRALSDLYGSDVADRKDYNEAHNKLDKIMLEFQQVGCYYKDWNFELGLVDFPSKIKGEDVLLCWKSDEESLQFYHGVDSGFVSRKPIPLEYLN